jgi:hypothetical protein
VKHRFTVVEEQDTTVAIAVGAFLDCEHYAHLHRSIMGGFELVELDGLKARVRQKLQWGFLRSSHEFILEYVPPGHFRSYGMKSSPWWIPSIHQFVTITVDVDYSAHPDRPPERPMTLMRFDVEMELPFWLYPFRGFLQKIMEKMHHLKDDEDIDMIRRRARLFGRDNNSAYLAEHQFILHKDTYVAHFGPGSSIRIPETKKAA